MRKMSVRKWRCMSTVWDESVSTSAHDSPGQIGASLIMKMTKRIDRIWFTVMIVMNLPHVCRNIRWIISRMLAAPLPPLQMQVDDWRAQNWTRRNICAGSVHCAAFHSCEYVDATVRVSFCCHIYRECQTECDFHRTQPEIPIKKQTDRKHNSYNYNWCNMVGPF